MKALDADYFDGKRSRKHRVSLIVSGSKLKVVGRDVSEVFDARGVRRSLRIAGTPRWLYLPGGGVCVTTDNEAVDRITHERGYERTLHRWESRPAYAALAVALVLGSLWLLFDRGMPLAIEEVSHHIPVEAETVLGGETLAGMEKFFLQPSKLPVKRQENLRRKLTALARAAGDSTAYRIEFRASRFGPNAFALPSGIIVMTDELVKLARRDEEILAVLAHEVGHVHHRHAMRKLLESSATALVVAGLTGDVSSAAALATAAPTMLLHTKFSRENEREADVYAVELLRKGGASPRHFAAILKRLEGPKPRPRALPTFLSSHPASAEREALAADATPEAEEPAYAAEQEERKPAHPPKLVAVDPVQKQIVAWLEKRDFDALDNLLGGLQEGFERDAGALRPLDNAFRAFYKVPSSLEPALDRWVEQRPASYGARLARGMFRLQEGLDARGGAYASETPEENMRAMAARLNKASADLQRSLEMTKRPYLSRLVLIAITRNVGSRASTKAHYQSALKLAPERVEARLSYMSTLEPRWGGSLKEMEAFLAESSLHLTDPADRARIAARIPAYRAIERQWAKDYAGALRLFDEAIALHPEPRSLCERSYALGQLERHEDAFADVKLAISKSRDDRYCLDRAPSVATKVHDPAGVTALLTLVLEASPESTEAYRQRGWASQQLGSYDAALQDYLAAAQLGDSWARWHTGRVYLGGGGTVEWRAQALAWLRKAAAEGHAGSREVLAVAQNDIGSALKETRIQAERDDDSSAAMRHVVYASVLGRRDEADARFAEYAARFDDDELWNAAFVMHRMQGLQGAALESWLATLGGKIPRQDYLAKALRERHAFMLAVIDRKPAPEALEHIRRVAGANNGSYFYAQVASGYIALLQGNTAVAVPQLRGPHDTLHRMSVRRGEHLNDLLPYLTLAYLRAGKPAEAEQIVEQHRDKVGVDSDYLVARALIDGASGRHEAALTSLRDAASRLPALGTRSFFPGYVLLEACEALLKQSGHDGYRELIEEFSQQLQVDLPYSWAAAFQARYARDAAAREAGLAAALVLDPASARMPEVPEAERARLRGGAVRASGLLGGALAQARR